MSSSSPISEEPKRAFIIHPVRKQQKTERYLAEAKCEEAVGLAAAIDLSLCGADIVQLSATRPATLLGEGKVEEYAARILEEAIDLVIINDSLTPVQQRNLERAWKCKVIDRTALILEIFGARARTREGTLQVELAALEYQKSRLVRSWTHLERQRGGFGFLGGPGETQIEADRRMISEQIIRIKKELDTVTRTRELHRKARRQVPYPIVALVGYTNAGKSTLFNRLTGESVLAENKLFATLDPTMRLLSLPSRKKVILSDTVGFISDLPTELIAAFRATLEEVQEADVLLHVRDSAHPDTDEQQKDVEHVLAQLGLKDRISTHMIEVLNKADLLEKDALPCGVVSSRKVAISALAGDGCDALLAEIDRYLQRDDRVQDVVLPSTNGQLLAWIYEHAQVVQREDIETEIALTIRISARNQAQLAHLLKGETA